MGLVRRWLWLALCVSLFGYAPVPEEEELLLGRHRAGRRQGQHRLVSPQDTDSDLGIQKITGDASTAMAWIREVTVTVPPPSVSDSVPGNPVGLSPLSESAHAWRGRAPPLG